MIFDMKKVETVDREVSKMPDKFKQQAKWLVFAEAVNMYS